jgi:multiple sugar transport system permease protein
VSTTTVDVTTAGTGSRPAERMRRTAARWRYVTNAFAALLGVVLMVWTFIPLYNMLMVALEDKGDVFSDHLWPPRPSAHSFWVVLTQDFWYLEHFWHQFYNSCYIAFMVTLLVLFIGTITSFSVSRMRIRNGWLITNAALLTYVIPASFLAIPFYLIMQNYGLHNNPWSVIAAEVTFATPYAIFIFQEYGRSIPLELDESARIDGASPFQIYWKIYLPLMAPALVAVGTYALLVAWNQYPRFALRGFQTLSPCPRGEGLASSR